MYELDRGEVIEVPPPKKVTGSSTGSSIKLLTEYVTLSGQRVSVDERYRHPYVERNPDTLRGADVMLFLRQPGPEDLRPTLRAGRCRT